MTARGARNEIRLRLVVEDPVPGVAHSLQDKNQPVDARVSASGEPLCFDFPVRIAPGRNIAASRCAARARSGASSISRSGGRRALTTPAGAAG